MYYVSDAGDDISGDGTSSAPWATLVHALDSSGGAAGGGIDDAVNGVQINCHGTISASRSIDLGAEYAGGPTATAPLILKGWDGESVDEGNAPVGEKFTYSGAFGLSPGTTYTAFFEEDTFPTSDVIFTDFIFTGDSTAHDKIFILGGNRWTFMDCVFQTSGAPMTGATKTIELLDDAKFINCTFKRLGLQTDGSSAGHNVISVEQRSTFYGCHFDFDTYSQAPYSCIKFSYDPSMSASVGPHYIIGCIFQCGDAIPIHFGTNVEETVFVLNSSFISDSSNLTSLMGGSNEDSSFYIYSNVATGFNKALGAGKSNWDCFTGGNSAYNNTNNFPTTGNVWHEAIGTNDDNIALGVGEAPLTSSNIPQSAIEDSGSREGVLGVAYPNYIGSNAENRASKDRGAAQKAAIVPNKVTSSVSGIF